MTTSKTHLRFEQDGFMVFACGIDRTRDHIHNVKLVSCSNCKRTHAYKERKPHLCLT